MNCSTPGLPVHHQLPEFTQTHVHLVSDAIQPSHPPRQLQTYAQPDERGKAMLQAAMEQLNLSARAYDRILKVARTIADLDGSEKVQSLHIAEAIGYRSLDRENWGA